MRPSHRRIHTVSFDLHGTLVTFDVDDVSERIMAAYQVYASAMPSQAPWQEFQQVWIDVRAPLEKLARESYRELRIADVAKEALRRLHGPTDPSADMLDEMVRAYAHVWIRNLSLSAGAEQVVRALRRDFKLALVSNYSDTATVLRILDQFRLSDLFDAVVVSAEIGWRKPHPAIFLEALRRTGSLPEDTVHIGDEPDHDVAGAEAVGITGILYDPLDRHAAFDGRRVTSLPQAVEYIRRLEG